MYRYMQIYAPDVIWQALARILTPYRLFRLTVAFPRLYPFWYDIADTCDNSDAALYAVQRAAEICYQFPKNA